MALNIKNPATEELARRLAARTGETLTDAVTNALRERLAVVERPRSLEALMQDIAKLQALVAAQPDRDPRTPDEILEYDAFGLPS